MRRWLVVAALGAAAAACGETATVENPSGGKLSLVAPGPVSIARGGMEQVEVRVKRENLGGDVAVRFEQLPAGVVVIDADKRIVGEEGLYTLRADADAALVENHTARVTASGAGGVAVTETFEIDVADRTEDR